MEEKPCETSSGSSVQQGKLERLGVDADVYSHRLDSYNSSSAQYNIATESLIREHFGDVSHEVFSLKYRGGDVAESIQKLIVGIMEFENPRRITNENHSHYFLAEKWTLKLSIDYQYGEITEMALKAAEQVKAQADYGGTGISSNPRRYVKKVDAHVRLISVDVNSISPSTVETIEGIARDAGFVVLYGFEVESGIPVTFAFPGAMGISYRDQSFEDMPLASVQENYTEEVLASVHTVLKRANEVTSGLVLISGPVGTGKSYLIRAILTELRQRRAVICSPATQFLESAGMLSQVGANFRKSLIVLEDIGQVVSADAALSYADARANLLNFSEGFLSLLMDAIVVISFNYDIDKIDPAILRPGRCLANIIVKELDYEHAQKLVSFKIPHQNFTLAEVYEMRRVGNADFVVSCKESIGFIKGNR